jgi:proteasome accessory factor C
LARALAKVAGALGVTSDAVDVELGDAPHLAILEDAARTHHQVELDYYVYGRDTETVRVVEPQLVYSASGQWYLAAYCHLAGADRLFRLDRVRRASVLPETFAPRPTTEPPPVFEPSPSDPTIVLELSPAAGWAATQYPTKSVVDLADGWRRVELWVSGEAWLARLLLRLGPDARVVAGDAASGAVAARRMLARYARSGAADEPVASSGP